MIQSKLILVSGYCAAGKSTFSYRLSEELKIPCFNKDLIKEILGDGFGPDYDMVLKKGSVVTFKLMEFFAEKIIKAGKSCVLESNFKLYEIEKLKTLAAENNCKCLTFIFLGDLDVLYDRYMKRDGAGERHWVHNAAKLTRENFIKGHLDQGMGTAGAGKTIVSESTAFGGTDNDALINEARKFLIDED